MKQVLSFLSELKANNSKEWFDKNRDRYQEARNKMLFVTELLINEINKFDPELGFPEAKDCMFRIFRDVRFSNDKTPYKVNMGSFMAKGGRKSIHAGYYLHIESGVSFIGGGSYYPQPNVLKALRTEIYENPDEFRSIITSAKFKEHYPAVFDHQLKKAPQGFPKDFEHLDLIKYKSYAFSSTLTDDVVAGEDFIEKVISAYKELFRVNKFLNAAIDKWL